MSDTIPQDTPQKQCRVCKEFLPATTEYFHASKAGKYGLRPHCKNCRSAIDRAKIITKQEVVAGSYKQCANCKRVLPANTDFFHRNKRKQDGFHQQCKDCKNNALKVYRLRPDVKEYTQSYTRHYRSLPEVKRRIRIYQSTPRQQERIRAYKSRPDVQERRSINGKNYRSRPEIQEHMRTNRKIYNSRTETQTQHRIREHKRRAHKRDVQGNHTHVQIQELLRRQRYKCYYAACGHAKFEQRNGKYIYHIEHTYPISRTAGTDIPANDISYIVLACPSCNLSKKDKFPWEWPEGGRLL